MGAEVRPGLREPDPAQAARGRRQMASRRGRADDRGREALAVARGGLERDGAGHPGPEPTRRRERLMKRFKSAGQAQRFLSAHDGINTLFLLRRHQVPADQ